MTPETKDVLKLWLIVSGLCWLALMVGVFLFGALVRRMG